MPSAVWSGHLHFGLVIMPVRLLVAARPKTTSFRRVYRRTGNHVVPPMQLPSSKQALEDEDSYFDGAGEAGMILTIANRAFEVLNTTTRLFAKFSSLK